MINYNTKYYGSKIIQGKKYLDFLRHKSRYFDIFHNGDCLSFSLNCFLLNLYIQDTEKNVVFWIYPCDGIEENPTLSKLTI